MLHFLRQQELPIKVLSGTGLALATTVVGGTWYGTVNRMGKRPHCYDVYEDNLIPWKDWRKEHFANCSWDKFTRKAEKAFMEEGLFAGGLFLTSPIWVPILGIMYGMVMPVYVSKLVVQASLSSKQQQQAKDVSE